jgi:RNA polymerase sigma-70 factor (ECF subfamily)
MTEPDLTQRLANDLDGNFEALVVALQGSVYRFAYRWCGNPEDAEEIAQDAFVRAYRALQGYGPERIVALRLSPWLLAIAVNVARNRARVKRLPLDGLDGLDEPVAAPTDEPERFSERRELSDQLAGALLELPPRYRAAVILRHVLGLGYDDIAETLQQPAGTVKSNVHRGIQLLRERLSAPVPARSH